LLWLTASANAATIVFTTTVEAGTQQGWLLGMDFTVNSDVTVTQLGAFDSDGDGFQNTVSVAIFDLDGNMVGSAAYFTGTTDPLIGGSRFQAVTPFTLQAGTTYSIVSAGYLVGSADYNGNSQSPGFTTFNNLGGALTLVDNGGRWEAQNSNALSLPTDNVGGYSQSDPVFLAGTFAVPDGGVTALLLGASLAGLGWVRRRML
jgi:hypothetical protein